MSTSRKMPQTRNEVAAAGLNAAVRLVAIHDRIDEKQAAAHLVRHLKCNAHQFFRYQTKEGLPEHYADAVLNFMKARDIPFYRYQLVPTRAVLIPYGIGFHNEVNRNA